MDTDSHGAALAVTSDPAERDLVNVAAPIPWLKALQGAGGLEVIDTPGSGAWISCQAAVDTALDGADAVLLVTDCSRQLTDASEVALLRRLADKRPIVVLNQIDRVLPTAAVAAAAAAHAPASGSSRTRPASETAPPSSLQQIVARVRASIDAALLPRKDDGIVLGERLPVFAVSTKRYTTDGHDRWR